MNCHVAPPSIDLYTPLPEYDDRAFACSPSADPDDLRVRRRDGDGADRRDLDRVGDVRPGDAVVDRLPQPAGPRRGVDRVEMLARRRVGHGDLGDPRARPERSDVAERQPIQHRLERARRRLPRAQVRPKAQGPGPKEGGDSGQQDQTLDLHGFAPERRLCARERSVMALSERCAGLALSALGLSPWGEGLLYRRPNHSSSPVVSHGK